MSNVLGSPSSMHPPAIKLVLAKRSKPLQNAKENRTLNKDKIVRHTFQSAGIILVWMVRNVGRVLSGQPQGPTFLGAQNPILDNTDTSKWLDVNSAGSWTISYPKSTEGSNHKGKKVAVLQHAIHSEADDNSARQADAA